MSNTEKVFREYIEMIEQDCNVEISEEDKKTIIEHCFEDDYIFDTLYAEIVDKVEYVIGELNP